MQGCQEDPELPVRQVVERLGAGAEVFGYDFLRVAFHKLREQEGVVFIESTIVENEQKFAASIKSLD